jgi:hypothetical protein
MPGATLLKVFDCPPSRLKLNGAYTNTEFIDRVIGHTPTTKRALLLKPHWLDPSISDRYVLCLLDAGYIWEDVTRTETNR